METENIGQQITKRGEPRQRRQRGAGCVHSSAHMSCYTAGIAAPGASIGP